ARVRAGDHVVAVTQGRDARTDVIADQGTDQAVAGGDGRRGDGGAAGPGGRSHAAAPVGGGDDVVAVAQGGDGRVHQVAGRRAGEAVGGRDAAREPGAAVGPGDRALLEVPVRAVDDVVAVAQGDDRQAHQLVGGADEAVAGGDEAVDPCRAVAPGGGPAVAVPVGAGHDVVAVAQGRDAGAAHLVAGVEVLALVEGRGGAD